MVPRPLLAVATILLFVAPVAGLGLSVRGAIATDVATRSAHDRIAAAQLASRLLADDLADAGQALTYLSMQPAVEAAFRASDRVGIAKELADFQAVWPGFTSALALDARGVEMAVASGPQPAPLIVRAAENPTAASDRSDRDYFQGAVVSDGPFVSEAYRSVAQGRPVQVAVSIALRDGDRVLGVLVGTTRPAAIIGSLTAADDTDGRELLIVDKRANVVASTDLKRLPLTAAGMPGIAEGLAGRSGTAVQMLAGGERVVTYVPVQGSSWVLYVIDEPTVVFAVERELQQSIGAAAAVATGVAAIFAAVVTFLFMLLSRRSDELARSRAALVAANADLTLANRHKSEFLSSVSHELRTPMNAIIGFTDLLDEQLRDAITDRQRRYFGNVREAGEHLLDLINDVLDLSRIESGRIDLRPESATLEQVFEPVVANARRAAAEHGLTFTAEIDDATVRLDVGRLRQVLYNLTSNAMKFTPSGGAIGCHAWIDGDTLRIDVSDTGIGIPADRQRRLFGMFERVNEDRSGAKGTGLGLALSKRLIETHGGTITFDSTEGAGTTFHVRLPGVLVEASAATFVEVADALAAR